MAITTRIILRHDDYAAFMQSTLILLKGELALAQKEDGNYVMKVGDGEHTFAELVELDIGNVILPVSQPIKNQNNVILPTEPSKPIDSGYAIYQTYVDNALQEFKNKELDEIEFYDFMKAFAKIIFVINTKSEVNNNEESK